MPILKTLIHIIVDAPALVSKIARTIIRNIKKVVAGVAEWVRIWMLLKVVRTYDSFFFSLLTSFLISEYFDDCDDDYNDDRKKKGILWRIFFSPLTRKHAFIISCIAVSIDPLFFYIPVIDEKNKCLGIDKRLKTAALLLRALPDAAFALPTIYYVYRILKGALPDADFDKIVFGILLSFISILIGGFLILPIPQVRD
ncbi:cyclic nucleotide-gated ion channel 1-like [Prunus yedoensis var. nudiflora]|uniref:Cyclic nucleotide-gated ion channel 1-like n=1 Tax=Prunus yedoensis var. nudiflora TaxID=2094558 RepID=A0A314YFN2_PRUYE|nr:cyclic nucleotide-gated ion channel 1-like [Prunus yedoensis var. nudiflora]